MAINIFIDLEATGKKNTEITSLGAVCLETGDCFYSLCKPNSRIEPIVARLTGIKDIDLNEAPDSALLSQNFSDWVNLAKSNAHLDRKSAVRFYCYDSFDKLILQNERNKYRKGSAAYSIYGYIINNLIDIAPYVRWFATTDVAYSTQPGLKAMFNKYVSNEDNYTEHNSLDDAKILRDLWITLNAKIQLIN